MKSDRLTKHYRSLAPVERLSVIVAASEREDWEERDRLIENAPRRVVAVPHHHALAIALDHLAHRYVSRQLELLGAYWCGTSNSPKAAKTKRTLRRETRKRAAGSPAVGFRISRQDFLRLSRELKREERAESWSDVAKMAAHLFCVNSDAWQHLCDELNINPEAVLAGVPGADEVERIDTVMRHVAFDAEQAGSYLKREAVSVEAMATAMRDTLPFEKPYCVTA